MEALSVRANDELDDASRSRRRPVVTYILGGALSVVLLGSTFRGVDTSRVAALLGGLGARAPLLLLPSFGAVLFECEAWRLALSLAGQRVRLLPLWGVRVASESIGSVLPLGAVWADALKPSLLLARCDVPVPAGIAAIAMRKYLLVFSQAVYLAVAFLVGRRALHDGFLHATGSGAFRYVALIAALALFLLANGMAALLARGHTFQSLLERLSRTRFQAFRSRLLRMRAGALGMDGAAAAFFGSSFRHRLLPIALVLAGWLLEATETWLMLRGVGATLGWGDAVGVEALVVLSRHLLPFLPGGLGVQELGYTALFAGVGCGVDCSLSLVVLKRAREAVWVSVGAVALSGLGLRTARESVAA